jgi:hypothetical protein
MLMCAYNDLRHFKPFSSKTTTLLNCKSEYIDQFRQILKVEAKAEEVLFYAVTQLNKIVILLVLIDSTLVTIHLKRMDFSRKSRINEIGDFIVKQIEQAKKIYIAQEELSHCLVKEGFLDDDQFTTFREKQILVTNTHQKVVYCRYLHHIPVLDKLSPPHIHGLALKISGIGVAVGILAITDNTIDLKKQE